MRHFRWYACAILLSALSACREASAPSSPSAPVVFAGPVDLPLHEDIKPKSRVVARVRHGDKLLVLQQRRRLYKLRTPAGTEGWTDERNLMNAAQMDALAQLEKNAKRAPSQGVATSFELLNVHTEPQRFSPSFVQIREGEKFEILAHQTAPRTEPAHRVLIKPQPRPATKRERKGKLPILPSPVPPKPPDDWLELSEERLPPKPKPVPVPPPAPAGKGKKHRKLEEPEQAPVDDWTLVRTTKGTAGWVLTSRIYLAIPDEVAQYAEGHRIVTYFSLGKIHDADLNTDKDIWLWTTVHSGQHPFDFDSYRVFTWNPRKHRYETAYIARTVEGYLPVLVKRENGAETFSICIADDSGARLRRQYVMLDRQVKSNGDTPCSATAELAEASPPSASVPPEPAPQRSLKEQLKQKAEDVAKRFHRKQ